MYQYTEKELAVIAKRENNLKRNYLVVNPLQGKHIPVEPKKAMDLFQALGSLVRKAYPNERLLLIGFAETATAIGSALAVELNSDYIQTTREQLEDVEYFYFSESHSHATEQKLVKNDLDQMVDKVERIVFVEDEVTTGNTILNIIGLMEKQYPGKNSFVIASLLNGMNDDSLEIYKQRNIEIHYLVKTNHEEYAEIAEQYRGDGEIHRSEQSQNMERIPIRTVDGWIDARRVTKGELYWNACEHLWQKIEAEKPLEDSRDILVLGTEEFMYPALYVAEKISRSGKNVKFHATTRSPILVSREKVYPLHQRYELKSVYEKERTTYIYDLKKYDEVYIITDAQSQQQEGIYSLVNALRKSGNEKIHIIRWC